MSSQDIQSILSKIANLSQNGHQAVAMDAFVEKLIEEKKFADLLPEVKEELKKDLALRVDDFIAARVISALSDQDLGTFEQMLKNNESEEKVQQFVMENIPDFATFLTNVLLEFRAVYLGLIGVPTVSQPQTFHTNGGSHMSPPPPPPPAPVAPEKVN